MLESGTQSLHTKACTDISQLWAVGKGVHRNLHRLCSITESAGSEVAGCSYLLAMPCYCRQLIAAEAQPMRSCVCPEMGGSVAILRRRSSWP